MKGLTLRRTEGARSLRIFFYVCVWTDFVDLTSKKEGVTDKAI